VLINYKNLIKLSSLSKLKIDYTDKDIAFDYMYLLFLSYNFKL